MTRSQVIIRHCDSYNVDRIHNLIREGMQSLEIEPAGLTILKPNTVIAHQKYFPHAFTRPEFIDGYIRALKEYDSITELRFGERCGITIPTRHGFSDAGYYPVLKKNGVKPAHFEEMPQVERRLRHPDALRDLVYIPEMVDRCQFFANAPKFKAHPWTKITCALKNYMGLQDDNHRLIDHDHELEVKIVDLQEVIRNGFIAV
ncbi:MAG: DUF362 domain-containing protein, partial [Chloroflexota bacterium]